MPEDFCRKKKIDYFALCYCIQLCTKLIIELWQKATEEMKMECTVRFANGTFEDFDTIQSAVTSLLESYPDGVIYDAGGDDHDADDTDGRYEIRNGRAAMVWACEADSVNDDGAKSVAEIVVVA